MSREAIESPGTGTRSDFDGNSVKWMVEGTDVTEYAGAYAGHTCATEWLGRGYRTVASLAEETLEPIWGKYPRTTMPVVELFVTSHCRPD